MAAAGPFTSLRRGAADFNVRLTPPVLFGFLCLGAIAAWWTWRALNDPRALDTGLAWDAGRLGWATGHPEQLSSWNGMTFLVAAMALLSRVISSQHTADLVTIVNLLLALGVITVVLIALRSHVSPVRWWIAAFALVSFGPLMSTVWWKQFNLMALVAAAGGFALARSGRRGAAALLIALSISIKPLFFVLPLVMLARRETRRIGAAALLGVVVIDVAAQALFALRAGHLSVLDPTIGPRNLIHKTSTAGNYFLCLGVNFSPTSMLCRLNGGFANWTLQRVLVIALVLILGFWVAQALRGRSLLSWDWFCLLCPFSVLLSALSWAHYQIVLAPLFLLLLVRLSQDGSRSEWIGFLTAFVLASLILAPFGNLVDTVQGKPGNPNTTSFLNTYAQFAQYILILTATFWYARHPLPARAAETEWKRQR